MGSSESEHSSGSKYSSRSEDSADRAKIGPKARMDYPEDEVPDLFSCAISDKKSLGQAAR